MITGAIEKHGLPIHSMLRAFDKSYRALRPLCENLCDVGTDTETINHCTVCQRSAPRSAHDIRPCRRVTAGSPAVLDGLRRTHGSPPFSVNRGLRQQALFDLWVRQTSPSWAEAGIPDCRQAQSQTYTGDNGIVALNLCVTAPAPRSDTLAYP